MNAPQPANLPTQIVTQKCSWCGVRIGVSVPVPCAAWGRERKLRNAVLAHKRICGAALNGPAQVLEVRKKEMR